MESCVFPYLVTHVVVALLFCKIHANMCMNNEGFFLQFNYVHTGEITHKCV